MEFIYKVIYNLGLKNFFSFLDDKQYLKLMYYCRFQKRLNLEEPKSFNEKLQWYKLNAHDSKLSKFVDKEYAKEIVESRIGKEYVIPTLGVWNKFESINWDKLPNRFVLKTTHDSGGVVICRDKETFDKEKAKKKLMKSMSHDYYKIGREWPYKNLERKIMAEKLIGDGATAPMDYKFFVFNDVIDSIMVCEGRESGHPNFYFYDEQWNRLYYQKIEKKQEIQKPDNLERMIYVAKKLARGFPEVRIDLYNIEGNIFFGEFTFYNQSGFDTDISEETDLYWGSKIQLPQDV